MDLIIHLGKYECLKLFYNFDNFLSDRSKMYLDYNIKNCNKNANSSIESIF